MEVIDALRRGMINSGVLCIMFLLNGAYNYIAGSYGYAILNAIASISSLHDAVKTHEILKAVKVRTVDEKGNTIDE